jgi:CRP-like cAMP-binding protein
MDTVKFDAGDTILAEGEDGNTAFLIINGSVEISVGEGAKAKTVGALNSGDVFGEMSLLEPGPRSATVRAITETECIVTSYDEFIGSIQDNPERAVEFMKTLVRRLRHMNELMASMDPAKRRIGDILKDWQKAAQLNEANLSDEDMRHYYATMYLGM